MKIICIGRNYANHAQEMGADLPKKPLFFMKPDTAILPKNAAFFYPEFTKELHYECELVIRIDKVGKNIAKKFAPTYYSSVGLGIDFTARDIQRECKKNGHPWEIAKSFEYSAPMSDHFLPLTPNLLNNLSFRLDKNGETVQEGNSKDMIFPVDDLIVYLSQFMTLKIGDFIFTGTPAGVGPVQIGDHLEGYINNVKMLDLHIK